MTTDALMDSVARTSRASAALMSLGALVVFSALWFATSRLNEVRTEVQRLELASTKLRDEQTRLQSEVEVSRETSRKLTTEVSGLRQALNASRDAIAAFHAKDYAAAIGLYDSALVADPGNTYLKNLRAYALFKSGRIDEAIKSQAEALKEDPSYAWGFFDLARFQCASGNRVAAAKSLATAQEKSPRFIDLARDDGEFRRLCGDLGKQ